LRECQYLYGGSREVTNLWIKYAVKSGNTHAVEWIMSRALQEYLKDLPHSTRHDDTGKALVLCIPLGLRTAFKLANVEMIEAILNWRIQHLAPCMKSSVCAGDLYHLFNYSGTKEAISVCLPDAMVKGANKGHTNMVRNFFETRCADFIFPQDVTLFRDGYNQPTHVLEEKRQISLISLLIEACIICGDLNSYDYFTNVGESIGCILSAESQFHTLLREGVSTTFIPILIPVIPYPDEWEHPVSWLHYICDNSNPVMLDYVRNIFSESDLLKCSTYLKEDYIQKEAALRDQCCNILQNCTSKKSLKRVHKLQARLMYLERILTNPPFNLDWETFRPRNASPSLSPNW